MLGLFALVVLASAQHPSAEAPCHLLGRFVDESGVPVAGVELQVRGWVASSGRARHFGVPADWRDPEAVRSDADGRFELGFVPPRAFQFTLTCRLADYAQLTWRWSELEAGARIDLGELTLARPGVIVGHLVDQHGNLLVEGWRVSASLIHDGFGGTPASGSSTAIDPERGTFRIDDLPPGLVRLTSRGANGRWSGERRILTKSGTVTEVELVHRVEEIGNRLVVELGSLLGHELELGPESVRALAPDGTVVMLLESSPMSGRWESPEIEPGTYRLEVSDPRLAPLRDVRVQTGRRERVSLSGSAALEVIVLDADGTQAVEDYGLLVRYPWLGSSLNSFTLAAAGRRASTGRIYHGILPGELELELSFADRPPERALVHAIEPGETRRVTVTIRELVTLRGRVVSADGAPRAAVSVQLTRGNFPGHDLGPDSSSWVGHAGGETVHVGYRDAEVRTDAEGHFAFALLAQDIYTVRAIAGPWLRADVQVELVPDTDEVEVRLPGSGAIELAFITAPPIDVGHRAIRALPPPSAHESPADRWLVEDQPIPASGSMRLEPVAVEIVDLDLVESMEGGGASYRDLARLRVRAGRTTRHVVDLRELERSTGVLETDLEVGLVELLPLVPAGLAPAGPALATVQPALRRTRLELVPGRYLARASDEAHGWRWDAPRALEVRANESFELELDVPFVERELRVRGTHGMPLAGIELTWWCAGMEPGGARAMTDGEGFVRLALPPLRYSLARANGRETEASFDWIGGAGPLDVVLPDRR